MIWRMAFFAGLMAAPLAAQDLAFSPNSTLACLQEAVGQGQRVDCIGASAGACMEGNPGGDTTVGMGGCLDLERAWWDERLNAAYRDLMAVETADDAEFGDSPGAIPKAPALREMQRAWITYRDARCGYEMAQWGGGTGGGPAVIGCLMQETGKQTLFLEDMLEGF